MTRTQCHAVRLRLGWSTRMLASKAGVPWYAVINFDYGTGYVDPDMVDALTRTLSQADSDLRWDAR